MSFVEKRALRGSSQRQLRHTKTDVQALVKSCKRSLKIAIGEQLLTPFELYTCLLEIANLLNQRPIGMIIGCVSVAAPHNFKLFKFCDF